MYSFNFLSGFYRIVRENIPFAGIAATAATRRELYCMQIFETLLKSNFAAVAAVVFAFRQAKLLWGAALTSYVNLFGEK